MMQRKLIFEKSRVGRRCTVLPQCDVPAPSADELLPQNMRRTSALPLPEVSEGELTRHYVGLSRLAYGVDNGFYPLGSCTMKYNPRVNEEVATLPGFTNVHPLQGEESFQGSLKALKMAEKYLCALTGMDAMTFQPAAGAHGEWTAMSMVRAYHQHRGDSARKVVLIPDSAHGTNPASAAVAGFTIKSIPSNAEGGVDIDKLREAVDETTAALMLTNPNTLGLFDKNISQISQIVHEAGGLVYYDGANMNAIMGLARPGDMGFDLIHLNLHKTFSTPHGGGGPGSGPVGCKAFLKDFLPVPVINEDADGECSLNFNCPLSIGKVQKFYGNFLVVMKALTYILILGGEGLRQASETAVLNANYMMHALADLFEIPYPQACMHEFVLSAQKIHDETGCSALDISKAMLDNGMHPPTMYFPLIVHEALMFEPAETEAPETLDDAVAIVRSIVEKAYSAPEELHSAPHITPAGRMDEVTAARNPILKYEA